MATTLPPGLLLSLTDCARLDGFLTRALRDLALRNGAAPRELVELIADINAAAAEFRANVQVKAGSGTEEDTSGSATRVYAVTERLTVPEVARLAGVSESYVRRAARRGDVRASRSGSRGGWLVDGGQAAAWAADRNAGRAD